MAIDIPAARREILWGKGYLLKGKRILRIHGKTCYRGLPIHTHWSKGGGRETLRRNVEVEGRVDGLDYDRSAFSLTWIKGAKPGKGAKTNRHFTFPSGSIPLKLTSHGRIVPDSMCF